jgi:galactose mutarotase-like enzyme
MPASFGFHPALRWPLPYGQPRADHAITFEEDEPDPIHRLDADGLVVPETFATPVIDRKLALRDDLFVADALIFDPVHSRRVRYGASAGPHLDIAFPDTPTLGIWTKPGAGYICIEPWRGHADSQGFTGDLRTKPGMTLIAPGEAAHWTMAITRRP